MKALFKSILLLILAGNCAFSYAQQKRKPNVIFILADDLGYGNVQSFNPSSKIPTPNLDRMAKEGTKFTRFYSGNTVCAPSRCALMTSKTMGHAWVRGNAKGKDGLGALRKTDTTLAERLKENGYTTGMFGKWGLGDEDSQGAPHLKGFDRFYGYLDQSHAHDYYTNRLYEIVNGKTVAVPVDSTKYTEDLIINKAVNFIEENKGKPFFLFLPLTVPHAELKVPAALLKPFQNADGSSKFQPETPFVKKGNYDSALQPYATFAAMVNKLDTDVGTILALIKKLDLDNDTYIFFSSDNGPHQEGGADPEYFNSSGPFRGIKRDLYEGGIRVPTIVRAPGKVLAGRNNQSPWAFWDILPTISELTGTKVPSNIDGLSFAPVLNGKPALKEHEYFYWQFNEGGLKEAITKGDWKLIRFKTKGVAERFELYNLQKDIAERVNLVSENPAMVKTLSALMKKAKTPSENPRFAWLEVEK